MHLQTLTTTLALGTTALAAQLTQVQNYNNNNARAKPQMYLSLASPSNPSLTYEPPRWVYKPDNLQSDALVVAIHSCQSSAQKYFGNSLIPWHRGSDRKGYITVWPSSTAECWDVSSKASLTHDGGGDSNAIANMIKYAVQTYSLDPKKVFITGGSSGGTYRTSSSPNQFSLAWKRK
jgi:acetylxylan esterase